VTANALVKEADAFARSILNAMLYFFEGKKMKCTECKYCYTQDTGSSNYTVMGIDFICLKKQHPDGDFDLFYEENEKLSFAEKCGEFVEGDRLDIDCDMERGGIGEYTDDEEIKQLYEAI